MYVEGYWKVRLICFILLVVFILRVVVASYLPNHIQQEFSGIELRLTGDDEYEFLQTLNIRIDGQVRNGMFASFPRFDGSLEVSAYDFTLDNPNLSIRFVEGFSLPGRMAYPVLVRDAGGSLATRVESLGMIYTNEDFSSLVINITEWTSMGGGSYQGYPGNRIIVAPATDGNTALEVLRSKDIFWSESFGVLRHPHPPQYPLRPLPQTYHGH
jgi:hypothetical protein